MDQFSTPLDALQTPSKRTFSESHITQQIRKQMLEDGSDGRAAAQESRSASPSSFKEAKSVEGGRSSSTSTAINASDREEAHNTAPTFPDPETITAETLDEHMLTAGTPPLDLLVRTSGVERLSDFMLWQCHENTSIVFLKCLWPEFDLWQFLPVLVEWQWQKKKLQEQQKSRALAKTD